MGLPKDVVTVKNRLPHDCSDYRCEVASKLIVDSPELLAMWRSLERRDIGGDELWVWIFLGTAARASNLPPFHYKPAKKRRKLSNRITTLANELANELKQNELDGQLFYSDSINYHGFFIYDDFEEFMQIEIDDAQTQKVKMSLLIQKFAERATNAIDTEPIPGKAGANARAIHFVRIVADRNERKYGEPLNAVTATAANAIFGTSYQESDIVNLLNR